MKEISHSQIVNWIGDDSSVYDVIDILLELLNGEYELEQMRKDVFDYADGEDE